MNRSIRIVLTSGVVGMTASGLVGCSASTTAPAPNCTKEAIAHPATGAAQALGKENIYAIDDLHCADGWAVTAGVLASKDDPQRGAPTSFVFKQEGQSWVVQDKIKVCGTNPITTTAPADAKIPAALFIPGCAAG